MAKPIENLKYPNLMAEMLRNREDQSDLALLLQVNRITINHKLSGKTDWTIGEIERICEHYDKNYYELFKD